MVSEITAEQLKEIIKEKKNLIILDVRFDNELQFGAIKNSILIPLPELPQKITEIEEYKEEKLVVYCRSGGRGKKAVKFLQENGFKETMNLVGGILAWREFDKEIIPY